MGDLQLTYASFPFSKKREVLGHWVLKPWFCCRDHVERLDNPENLDHRDLLDLAESLDPRDRRVQPVTAVRVVKVDLQDPPDPLDLEDLQVQIFLVVFVQLKENVNVGVKSFSNDQSFGDSVSS